MIDWPQSLEETSRTQSNPSSDECLLLADSVEKLRITMIRKFIGIFRLPGALTTDQLCRSELRQARFSCDFCYPLVPTVRNVAQIANKIVALFKTEFFNRIGRLPPFVVQYFYRFERLLSARKPPVKIRSRKILARRRLRIL